MRTSAGKVSSGALQRIFLKLIALAVLVAVGLSLALAAPAQYGKKKEKVFPYPIQKKTLSNGLDVIVIETPEFKDVLSFNTLVLAGARNEVEPGKSGLAHLFEHILFRHRYEGKDGAYEDLMRKLGTHNNAWTWFDVTYYHPLTFTSNLTGGKDLPGLFELESARFTSLDFTEKIFRTESGAVLGEYRRNASFPSLRLSEEMLALQFPNHPYGHTTMGFIDDVMDMPNEYKAALEFYDNYYRPNNCILVVTGDVQAAEIFALAEKYYGQWEAKETPVIATTGAAPGKEQRKHVPWDADVAPLVWVSYRTPAFKPGTPEGAVALLLNELLVSEAAPLTKKLRYEKQTTSALFFAEGTGGLESFDPRALTVSGRLFKAKYTEQGEAYANDVINDVIAGLDDLKRFSKQKGSKKLLDTLKSKYRYDFLSAMSSPANIAQNFALFYRFDHNPEVFEKMIAAIEKLQPKDIDAFAKKYFTPERRAVLTLAYDAPAQSGSGQ